MILDGFYDDARAAIRAKFLGKRVAITECATTVPEDLEWATGTVVRIEFGTFGYEGEGDARFWLEDVTDAGRNEQVARARRRQASGRIARPGTSYEPVTVNPKDRKCKVMVSNNYTQIDILD